MYPLPASTSVLDWSVAQFCKGWGQNPLERRLKVVDTDTGETVAVALWFFFPDRRNAEKDGEGEEGAEEKEEWKVPPRPQMEYHEEYVKEAWDQLLASAWSTRHEIMGGQPYVCK